MSALERFHQLQASKVAMEEEAEAIIAELNSPGPNGEPPVGVKEPLVDKEGFPRSDVDLYNIRHKRQRLSQINYDHKALMREIEEILPKCYEENAHLVKNEAAPVQPNVAGHMKPIAKIDEVVPNSPSYLGGIRNEDLLLQFGNVNASTPEAFPRIADLVKNSMNREIPIIILRGTSVRNLIIVPRQWEGRGALGCHLAPIK